MKKILYAVLIAFTLGAIAPVVDAALSPYTIAKPAPKKGKKKKKKHRKHRHHRHHHHRKAVVIIS
jgi:hypothetical protein